MSNYMGIIFTVVGLFSTTVLFSICMSCYKCIMKRRRKALSLRTEQEKALAAGNVEAQIPNGAAKYAPAPSSSKENYRNQLHKNKAVSGHGKNPVKSIPINGRKYPKITSSVVHGRERSPVPPGYIELDSGGEQALKRHSFYYSVESMASLASAIEDNP